MLSQTYVLKDKIREAIVLEFESNKKFKHYKLYSIFINPKTITKDKLDMNLFYEVIIHFGKIKYELRVAEIPVLECNNDLFSFVFAKNSKRGTANLAEANNCMSVFEDNITRRFKKGLIVTKDRIFLNPTY